jgi:hypothetical protein
MKETFKIIKDGKDIELAVTMPNAQQSQDAQLHYRKIFARAIKDEVILRDELEKKLIQRGLWGAAKEAERLHLLHEISSRVDRLAKGGIKLSEGRVIALEIKDLRESLRDLVSEKTILDSNTVEGLADNAKFDFLVSQCTVYNLTGEKYFRDLDDYYSRTGEVASYIAAGKLMQMLYGVDSDYELSLPENQFLTRFKMVDDKLRYINKEGKLTDKDGRLIDEDGNYINENGEFIDIFGNKVETKQDDIKPFLDEDGNEIVT